jgi:hypothetical protein
MSPEAFEAAAKAVQWSWSAWFHSAMPYAFVRLDRPGNVWLPLNRDYKPLGIRTTDWVEYDDHADSAIKFARDPSGFPGVWWNEQADRSTLYLYSDAPCSRLTYWERLGRLLSHSHRMASSIRPDDATQRRARAWIMKNGGRS